MKTETQKIKLVVGISDFRIGGAQKVVADIIKNLNLSLFEVHLIVLSNQPNQDTFYDLVPAEVTVHRLHFSSFRDVSSWRQLFILLKQIKPGVVWSHLFFSNTVFRVLKPLFGYKVITVEHNTYVNKTFGQKVTDWLLSFVTYKIVAVSDYVAEFTAKQEHISKKKFVTIFNGVDVGWYRSEASSMDATAVKASLGFQEEDKVVVSVGQLIKQKNHTLLLDAFAQFIKIHPEYKLIILGEGPQRNELEANIQMRGINSSVKLLGVQKNTPTFYAISDFFVLPSLFEGFGLVCIEAMACGLPVLTTKVAGPDTYIDEEVDGFFFAPTVDDLVKKLVLMASLSSEQMTKMRQSAENKASEYDLRVATQSYEKLLRDSLS
ncbi:MAG: glycosyltransferase [Candidatus Pacebacteria bacterium]|nr:glycosyltransferase [Candidatus Paceibacterota bacterium]MBP9842574.1 glycosyltransferase [Candidatus Paceibacterota bacterium]